MNAGPANMRTAIGPSQSTAPTIASSAATYSFTGIAAASMASACHPITDEAEIANPNVVKVVLDHEGYALYFSRSRIPHARVAGAAPTYRHIGLYAYRVRYLREYAGLAPSPLERAEALEQLRALWYGHRIAMVASDTAAPPGVDTREDLETVRRMWK